MYCSFLVEIPIRENEASHNTTSKPAPQKLQRTTKKISVKVSDYHPCFLCVFLCCWGAKSYDTAAIDLQMCVNYVYPSGMHTVLFISSSWQKKGSPSSLIKERERSLFPRDFVFYDWTTPVEKKCNIIQRSHCRANISWIKRPTKNELKGCHSI